MKWVDVNVGGWESGGGVMEWIYRLRWDSRECNDFIMKGIEMVGD